jgi:aldose 1-epimerase
MGTASFVLVPYANRIAGGRFEHQGRAWQLPRNFGAHAHPLHGTGWKRPWSVTVLQPETVELQLQHQPDAHWPWAFTARQRIRLLADEVRFELEAINTAAETAPMGSGFHPAFAACPATILRTRFDGVWLIDADSLPTSLAPASTVLQELPAAAHALRSALVDHCFTGWSRELVIDRAGDAGDMRVMLTASKGLEFLQLYTPPGKNWFCAEPMSQMPDAINRREAASGLRVLQPGESLQASMTIAVQETPGH